MALVSLGIYNSLMRGSSEVERWTHNPEAAGAIPAPASITLRRLQNQILELHQ